MKIVSKKKGVGKEIDEKKSVAKEPSEKKASMKAKDQIVCPFYLKDSGCWFGTRCKNMHLEENVDEVKENYTKDHRKERKLCIYFMDGRCKFNDKCHNSHEPTPEEISRYRTTSDGSKREKRMKLCPFFMEGKCTFGRRCKYSHEPPNNNRKQEEERGHRGLKYVNEETKKTKDGKFNESGNGKRGNEIGDLVDGFKHLSKQMHFLEFKVQKISRYSTGKRKM